MFCSPSPAPPAAASPAARTPFDNAASLKRKRRPAGTPGPAGRVRGADPEAEVVSLSPRTLLESDRYVCEICNQGFQRDQNLQMHRRRHKVPWKLLKRESGAETRKRVFVCPEPSCLHHDPSHALGDLVGIKKHFRRKHSAHKQWACGRCSKAYAVHSDYKAHLKTCGTRGHSCDCGRVFSRVESFIEHQDNCNVGRTFVEMPAPPARSVCLSRPASSKSPASDQTHLISSFASAMWPSLKLHKADQSVPSPTCHLLRRPAVVELQLLPNTKSRQAEPDILRSKSPSQSTDEADATKLSSPWDHQPSPFKMRSVRRLSKMRREQLGRAMTEKAVADEARQQAKRQMELAEQEFANARRIRQQAQLELNRAVALRDHAAKKIHSTLLQITCFTCKQLFHSKPLLIPEQNSLAASYMSSVVTEAEGDDENLNQGHEAKASSSN
ncbi:hypothetical protein HPP92_026915 [Vanilla planifolia]|uniref:C2H2-type domain-containing protein n=1 Tax=Vanilla planifolia TaxID=51239 RepID=A0A835PDH1_VANPL|nr:hypothetical protein HPP92_026915 [Vanilla planifolia]